MVGLVEIRLHTETAGNPDAESLDPEVAARIKARLGSKKALRILSSKYHDLAEALRNSTEEYPDLGLYKALLEISSIYLFGLRYQEIQLDKPFHFTVDDELLLTQLEEVADKLRGSGQAGALQQLDSLPKPVGSRCDKGEFNSYTQEILIGATYFGTELKSRIQRRQKRTIIRHLPEIPNSHAITTTLLRGYWTSDRELIFSAMNAL